MMTFPNIKTNLIGRTVNTSTTSMPKKVSRLFGLSAIVIALNACQTIPALNTDTAVARPNIPLNPGEGYEVYGNRQVPSSLASVRWQTFYTDPKLKQLIALGLENNKDIRQAILAIQKAQAQYRISDSSDLPTIGLEGGYSRGANNIRDRNPSDSYNVGLGLASYELDFWGKISSLKEQALQNYLATSAAKDTVQTSLIANIAKSYVSLSYQLKQLELATKTLQSREESLRITRARLNAGIDSKAPSLQAAASAETARIAALDAQSGVLKAKNALKYLIGAPLSDDLLPGPAVSKIATDTIMSAGLPSDLLLYRPDVLQAEYRLKAAGANINVARAAYYPTISLTGNLGYSSGDLSDLFKSSAASWSFGPSINLPIFDAGQRDANYDVAQVERQQALAEYESTIETAFKEVSDVLAERATLDARTASQYRQQENYNEIFNISEARYIAQVDDYLSVLDAQRSLFSTQLSILSLEQERLFNQIELYQVLGGGANLGEPKAIPTPQNTNLVNILNTQTDEQKAVDAVKAASAPKLISAEEADAIESAQPATLVTYSEATPVDLDGDRQAEAVVADVEIITPQANDITPYEPSSTADGYVVLPAE